MNEAEIRFDPIFDKPLSQITDVEELRHVTQRLWNVFDDIRKKMEETKSENAESLKSFHEEVFQMCQKFEKSELTLDYCRKIRELYLEIEKLRSYLGDTGSSMGDVRMDYGNYGDDYVTITTKVNKMTLTTRPDCIRYVLADIERKLKCDARPPKISYDEEKEDFNPYMWYNGPPAQDSYGGTGGSSTIRDDVIPFTRRERRFRSYHLSSQSEQPQGGIFMDKFPQNTFRVEGGVDVTPNTLNATSTTQ